MCVYVCVYVCVCARVNVCACLCACICAKCMCRYVPNLCANACTCTRPNLETGTIGIHMVGECGGVGGKGEGGGK